MKNRIFFNNFKELGILFKEKFFDINVQIFDLKLITF